MKTNNFLNYIDGQSSITTIRYVNTTVVGVEDILSSIREGEEKNLSGSLDLWIQDRAKKLFDIANLCGTKDELWDLILGENDFLEELERVTGIPVGEYPELREEQADAFDEYFERIEDLDIFCGKLEELNIKYELSGSVLIVKGDADGNADLSSLSSIPERVRFNNDGRVSLEGIKILPENIEFNNQGDVYLNGLTEAIPESTKINNNGVVYKDSKKTASENTPDSSVELARFKIGRGGRFNNGGHITFKGMGGFTSADTEDLFVAFENRNQYIEILEEIFEGGVGEYEITNEDLEKHGITLNDLGPLEYVNCDLNSVGLQVGHEDRPGLIDNDGDYDSVVVVDLLDLDENNSSDMRYIDAILNSTHYEADKAKEILNGLMKNVKTEHSTSLKR